MHFDCISERVGDAVVVTPNGEVDRDTAPRLQAALEQAVRGADGGRVEVDLRHVGFIDSSGVGALLSAYRLAGTNGATFQVRDPVPAVRTVLDITNVWNLLS
ncbi:STAS domain-containing protein [Jidongwangia harbinensis]|uniref:STAS domain-containing protein n=1 Tax=Jidongwangia harbinensis TaxID=2878561 RepID=UPI001CD9CD77|nr:STAS domain-containing protein [Jidongwangia harbinensis]MCA2213228.1 STAS domain-containing protein [Jidongwangia harbinensis]